ncbi:MAG: HEPN domain-containing protein [Candidatus Poribacteria bacterium]|nr:HEPN domain-containing protein [Candidatus Poribacteria bacterium]
MDMVTREDIQATCNDIVREFAPLQIVLFGSYAYGTPREYSDVDLLVVMPGSKSETRAREREIYGRIPHRFRMDLLVRSPEEIAYRLSYNDWFLREITEKGEVLYESANFLLKPPKKEQCAMNPLTVEWVENAEEDYIGMRQLQQGQHPLHNIVCFHAQQCVEKYLKAWLQEANIPFSRTHDLKELLALIVPSVPIWQVWKPDFSSLSKHAVVTRYPGASATVDDAESAVGICDEVRQAVREQLKLPLDVENN